MFRCGLFFLKKKKKKSCVLTICHTEKLLEYEVGSQMLNKVKLCSLSEAGISCTQNLKLFLDWGTGTPNVT